MFLSEDGIQQAERQRDNRTDDGARSQTAAAEQQHGAQRSAADGGKDDCLGDLHRYVFLLHGEEACSLPSLISVS